MDYTTDQKNIVAEFLNGRTVFGIDKKILEEHNFIGSIFNEPKLLKRAFVVTDLKEFDFEKCKFYVESLVPYSIEQLEKLLVTFNGKDPTIKDKFTEKEFSIEMRDGKIVLYDDNIHLYIHEDNYISTKDLLRKYETLEGCPLGCIKTQRP